MKTNINMISGSEYMQKQLETLTTKQREIFNLLKNRQFSQVLQQIQQDLLLIHDTIPALTTIIKCFQPPSSRVNKCFELLESFIKSFGIPLILHLNHFTEDLKVAVQHGWSQSVKYVLQACFDTFAFDQEKSAIRKIMSLCEELGVKIIMNKDLAKSVLASDFTGLFHKTQQALLVFGKTMIGPEYEKEKLSTNIRSILEDISLKLKDNLFNPLEKECIVEYSKQLGAALVELLKNQSKPTEDQSSSSQSTRSSNDLPNAIVPIVPLEELLPLNRFRRKFVKGERLLEDESATVEYKDYSWPFSEDLNRKLRSTINSFINRRGGRIYIGVDDSHMVKGIKLLTKQRDELKLNISMLVRDFDPPIKNEELVRVDFIGIEGTNPSNKVIPGLFVVKIIIQQGDPSVIYSEARDYFQAYIRNDGQSLRLNAREIREYTQKRFTSPEPKLPASEFDDPKPEPIQDKDERKVAQENKGKQAATPDVLTMLTQAFKEAGQSLPQSVPTSQEINRQPQSLDEKGLSANQISQPDQNQAKKHSGVSPANKSWQQIWKEKHQVPLSQKIFRVDLCGLLGMVQQEFDDMLKGISPFTSRMYKTEGKTCNGNAFAAFENVDEANKFIQIVHNSQVKISTGTVTLTAKLVIL